MVAAGVEEPRNLGLILVAIVVVTGFIQQRQTMRNQTQANPQMAIISKVFPVVFAFISWGLPSGVGLYFATSNLWQIGQQEVVYRTMLNPAGAGRPIMLVRSSNCCVICSSRLSPGSTANVATPSRSSAISRALSRNSFSVLVRWSAAIVAASFWYLSLRVFNACSWAMSC